MSKRIVSRISSIKIMAVAGASLFIVAGAAFSQTPGAAAQAATRQVPEHEQGAVLGIAFAVAW